MRGNSHVRFLGGRVGAIPPGYPTSLAPCLGPQLSTMSDVLGEFPEYLEWRGMLVPTLTSSLTATLLDRAILRAGHWTIEFRGSSFRAYRQGPLSSEAAERDLAIELDRLVRRLSFLRGAQCGYSRPRHFWVWARGQRVPRSLAEEVCDYEEVARLVRDDTPRYLSPGDPSNGDPELRRLQILLDTRSARLDRGLDLFCQALSDPSALVKNALAVCQSVKEGSGSAILSDRLLRDVAFLANGADIGVFSRHPECHSTDHLPADAAEWIITVCRTLILAFQDHLCGAAVVPLDRSRLATPEWIRARRKRP
jgi:hypothetical protein